MISIVSGVPGSGKSYYMVNYLSKFYTYDEFYKEFHIKENILVISNIDDLRVPHLKLDSPFLIGDPENGIEGKYSILDFFTVSNFQKLMEIKRVKNIILLIDESQKLFPRDFKDKDVLYFFQYHRHLGVDIILGCQDHLDLSRSILALPECIYQAVPRSKAIAGAFRYHVTDRRGKHMRTQTLRKRQAVFSAYKSYSSDEIQKPKNIIMHWIIIFCVFMTVGGLLFKTAVAGIRAKSEKHKQDPSKPVARTVIPEPMKNISSSRINPALTAFSPVSSSKMSQPVSVQGSNNLSGFLPPYTEPQKPAVSKSAPLPASTIESVHNRAVPQDAAELSLNERKTSLSVYYVWRNKTDSGMTDDIANIPVDATYKRYRATW
ncbi:Zonular occludens toxin (Zot) [Trichlorobacter thiogenes]|uniref:Zonular occludens toxin (Zot) n=1 Tax=Trichlorobacter thiogenes TaxID=115783 RepID=A0A1T4SA27_9BACT|nr:zonular occludens toxin domain-containing protein [Trichlorobacter thiogenes]SKA25037.1 Zonular occludens toxin (Zot) [Trichlorobacter thiogenes]